MPDHPPAPNPKVRLAILRYIYLAYVYIVPTALFIHGVLFRFTSTSSEVIVYGVKLVSLALVIALSSQIKFSEVFALCISSKWGILAIFVFAQSTIVPLITNENINWFYYFADLLGFSVFIYSALLFRVIFQRRILTLADLMPCFTAALLITLAGTSINFFLGNGSKISTPAEIHVHLALFLIAYFTPLQPAVRSTWIQVMTVFAGVILTQFRMYFVIAISSIAFAFFRLLKTRNFSVLAKAIVACIFVVLGFQFAGEIIQDRIDSVLSNNTELTDRSIDQRFVENDQMLSQLSLQYAGHITGCGFGAEYGNHLIDNAHYSKMQHHAHASPFVVLFRNGALGLFLIYGPLLVAFRMLFSKNTQTAIIGYVFVCLAVAGLTDLYIYWSSQSGMVFALLLTRWGGQHEQRN